MAKDTFYFSHDYNSRADEKIKLLIRRHGILGYGIFWAIIEDLYNNANALRTDYEGIAFDLRVDIKIVKSVINDFDLFIIKDDFFGSFSVQRRLEERNAKSKKASDSANYRWNKSKDDANAMRTQCDGNAIKERKGKEIKEKEEVKHNIGEKQKLVFPYNSERFMLLWNELVKMPKWRKKPFEALQLTLHKLSEFDEEFVIELIENAITGNYQGIIFSNTKEKYEQFKNQNYGGKNIGNNAKKQGVSKQELANILYEHFQNRDNSNE